MIECEESTEGWMVRRVQIDTSEGAVCGHACELKQKAAELKLFVEVRVRSRARPTVHTRELPYTRGT